jgi:hypothetical protein
MRSVGEYSLTEAFTIARSLEHAGITTEIAGTGSTWRVLVPAEAYDRANTHV